VTLLCKCMNTDCPNPHFADKVPAGEGMYAPGSGYGEVTVILGRHGPRIDGEIPNRIGVDRTFLDMPPTTAITFLDGELRILHTRWKQIGQDGTDIMVFERVPE
jgi:hypothetical protein